MTEVYCRRDCKFRVNNRCLKDKILILKLGDCSEFRKIETKNFGGGIEGI